MYLLTRQQEASCTEILKVEEHQVEKYVKAMKNNKAADVYGVISEHLKFASQSIIKVLTQITNNRLQEQRLPTQSKTGKIVSAHKKGKPILDRNSYRKITVSGTMDKPTEAEMLHQSQPTLKRHQSKNQLSSLRSALLTTVPL